MAAENIGLLGLVKRKLVITWSDKETDRKLKSLMSDAVATLNHKLGAEFDYEQPGQARNLFLNYMLYAWNDCTNEFDSAYMSELLQLRHVAEVNGTTDEE